MVNLFHVKQWAVPARNRLFHVKQRPAPTSCFRVLSLRDRSRAMISQPEFIRRHRHRRRPCRLRGRERGCADGREDGAGDPSLCDHRRDVLQSRDRRARQGPSGPRGRCAGRPDGPGRRCRRHPVPDAQSPQGSGGPRSARPGRPQALRGGDAGRDPRDRQSQRDRRRGGRAARCPTAASPAFAWPTAASCRPARWSSPPAPSCAA